MSTQPSKDIRVEIFILYKLYFQVLTFIWICNYMIFFFFIVHFMNELFYCILEVVQQTLN